MDVNTMDQGLLTRNPSLSREEFSHHWYHKHAPLVIPMFLYLGIQHYQQIHGPFTSSDPTLDLISFDGVAGLPPQSDLSSSSSPFSASMPKWVQAYYDEVIKVDERKFLVSEALEHVVRVPPKTVVGTVKVVIGEGRVLVHVGEEVWGVWRGYERRGKEVEGEEGERKREGVSQSVGDERWAEAGRDS